VARWLVDRRDDPCVMDHVVVPFDRTHADAHAELVQRLVDAAGLPPPVSGRVPHITVVAHSGLTGDDAHDALLGVVADVVPFTIHAHGFGFFSGDTPSNLSLYVPVTRTAALDALHRRVCDAVRGAGGEVARWCEPDRWTPHITLLDRTLDPDGVGRATAWLARRHHPSWDIPVDGIALLGGWGDRAQDATVLAFGPD
jgi:2'-5' RNA ligase